MPMHRCIYLLFLLSGCAGLIYQVVWSRLLNEIFGVTAYAVTTVLATFLAALALGSVFLGRIADRRENPLRFYGWLEIGIGMAGLAGAWIVDLIEPLHIAAANRFERLTRVQPPGRHLAADADPMAHQWICGRAVFRPVLPSNPTETLVIHRTEAVKF